jgi:pyruvate, water dikinase
VGGKNASLGEMVRNLTSAGVHVPDGFATTADAYRHFIFDGGLAEMINAELAALDTDDVEQLAAVGRKIREAVTGQPFPANLEADIRSAYTRLADESDGASGDAASFAVRSSATAEDLPDVSLQDSRRRSSTSAASTPYWPRPGRFSPPSTAIARASIESITSSRTTLLRCRLGAPDAVFLTSSYGLGEAVVQGAVNPDEFYIHKPALQAGRPAIRRQGTQDGLHRESQISSCRQGRRL